MNRREVKKLMKKFLQGKLSPSEYGHLEKMASEDAVMAEEWEVCKFQKQVMQEITASDLRKKMAEWDAQSPTKPISTKKKPWWPMAIGAAMLLAAAIFFFTKKNEKAVPAPAVKPPKKESPALPPGQIKTRPEKTISPSPEKKHIQPVPTKPAPNAPIAHADIARQHYEPLSTLQDLLRGNEAGADSLAAALLAADEAYQTGNLRQAIQRLAALAKKRPNSSRLKLVLGRLYFESGNYRQAVQTLRPIAEKPSIYTQQAQWYLLLAYLARYDIYQKEYEKEKAAVLAVPGHFAHAKVAKIRW
ncbi:MAG TPA: tetratricopeptide repeat protein [Bacteroidetes bacterium]|nr:tetratricopeptide repeat protein [Bacteroidota bacterium]